MTGDQLSPQLHRRTRHQNRALKSTNLALDQIQAAVQAQITVVDECSDKIRAARTGHQLKSACFAASNEVKRLQAIVCQLDYIVDRIPDDLKSVSSPQVQSIREQVSECIRQMPDLTISYHDKDPDQELADEESSIRSNLSDGTICDLEAGVIVQRRLQTSMQELCADINSLSETSQKESTDRIDTNVNLARDRLTSGAVILSKISRNGSLPLIGAAIGTAVCGPIGMLLGYKVAAVACLGTATAGYLGGKVVEQKAAPPAITRTETTEDEMNLVDEEQAARDR